ncbi:STAS domain-containing protein [Actinotalea sp. BY-33]|uniref:STAS domain-containing protein n=1 Tax=Actinotalea soli TaxID=2819234 RepID=A0A939LQY6_9CELL|nr:STAS domain-containing protein [Actinotalea soli]MBO1751400.1 STAS domain-containing protein [Actinotalea soli]
MELHPIDAGATPAAPPLMPAPPPSTPHGSVRLEVQDERVHVVLRGEIDTTVKEPLSDALDGAAHLALPVEVDCTGVAFIDSSGLSALLWLANVAAEPPRLLHVPPSMHDLLTLTGTAQAFTLVP